jgi:hypothetical protein
MTELAEDANLAKDTKQDWSSIYASEKMNKCKNIQSLKLLQRFYSWISIWTCTPILIEFNLPLT